MHQKWCIVQQNIEESKIESYKEYGDGKKNIELSYQALDGKYVIISMVSSSPGSVVFKNGWKEKSEANSVVDNSPNTSTHDASAYEQSITHENDNIYDADKINSINITRENFIIDEDYENALS